MTLQQMKWAEQHDWFWSAGAYPCGHRTVWVVRVRPDTDEPYDPNLHVFKDYQKLREWAGY